MREDIVIRWGDDLNDLIGRHVSAAVALIIGSIYGTCRDGSILGMVLNHADHPIREQMKELLADIEHQSLMYRREEKTEFTVQLDGLADAVSKTKIDVIKAVREVTGLALKECKDLVEAAPVPVRENVSREEAVGIKARLEECGAVVRLK